MDDRFPSYMHGIWRPDSECLKTSMEDDGLISRLLCHGVDERDEVS